MKFVVDAAKRGPRLGWLTQVEKHPTLDLETPMAMLYTRGGSIPHITYEVYKSVIKGNKHIIQIPLVTTYNFEDAMTEFQGNISDFVGMSECISCVTIQDPADYTQPGHHFQDFVPIWTRKGKVLINSTLYMNVVEAFKPDMYYLLSDGDTNVASSEKRSSKAVNNTVTYFKQCMERHKQSEILKNAFVMGAISGGFSFKARKECIDAVCGDDAIRGYLIDGLHNNGPEVELQTAKELKPIVKYVIDKLPPNKLRALHGCWNPVTVLEMIQLGVDLFDTSYCYILTERSCALTFSFDGTGNHNQYELNLRQPECADDFQPLLTGCTCLACLKYSRGYIHHLVTVQELLGPLLITIHNIHHYLRFFEKIRECIRNGTLQQLQEKVATQFNEHQKLLTKTINDSTVARTTDSNTTSLAVVNGTEDFESFETDARDVLGNTVELTS